jgi:FAD/FMN-containing dehydrogenase
VAIVRGHPATIERHKRDLEAMAAKAGAAEFMVAGAEEVEETATLLREFTAKLRLGKPAGIGARIGMPSTETPGLLRQLRADAEKEHFACAILFQASGLAHLTVWNDAVSAQAPADEEAEATARLRRFAQRIFEAAKAHRAQAVIEWCPATLKSMLNAWGEPGPEFALLQKVKTIFDPGGTFSPGCFVGGL